MSMAKALSSAYLPIAAVLINHRVYDAVRDNSGRIGTFGHGYTYSGHPVSATVAMETLKIYEERNILDHVHGLTPTFARRMRALADHPLINEARCVDLVGNIEIVRDKKTKQSFDPTQAIALEITKR